MSDEEKMALRLYNSSRTITGLPALEWSAIPGLTQECLIRQLAEARRICAAETLAAFRAWAPNAGTIRGIVTVAQVGSWLAARAGEATTGEAEHPCEGCGNQGSTAWAIRQDKNLCKTCPEYVEPPIEVVAIPGSAAPPASADGEVSTVCVHREARNWMLNNETCGIPNKTVADCIEAAATEDIARATAPLTARIAELEEIANSEFRAKVRALNERNRAHDEVEHALGENAKLRADVEALRSENERLKARTDDFESRHQADQERIAFLEHELAPKPPPAPPAETPELDKCRLYPAKHWNGVYDPDEVKAAYRRDLAARTARLTAERDEAREKLQRRTELLRHLSIGARGEFYGARGEFYMGKEIRKDIERELDADKEPKS